MKRTVLLTAVALGLTGASACNRTDATREAREAAGGVKAVAAAAAETAGERIADSWLTAKVQAKFFADDEVKARYIDVSSRDGAVTLEGFVEDEAVRQKALQLARNTDGVARVDDRLLIGQTPPDRANTSAATPLPTTGGDPAAGGGDLPDEAMVTSLIQARYFVDPGLKMRNIEVAVSNRVVTLRGSVGSDDERARALLLARTTRGVERVEDGLSVDASLEAAPAGSPTGTAGTLPARPIPDAATPTPAPGAAAPASRPSGAVGTSGALEADASIERAIRTMLDSDRQLRGASIEVSARDGVVLLQGTVASPAARQRALALVRGGEGVVQVVDRIAVK